MAITVREALTIRPLARADVVAGAAGLDRVIPQAVKETADHLGLPVLAIPYDCSWIDILSPLHIYLLDEETKQQFHAQQVNAHFISILLQNQGLSPLLKSLSATISCPVAVFDMNKNLLACAAPESDPAHNREAVAHLNNIANAKDLPLTFPIFLSNTQIGFLAVYATGSAAAQRIGWYQLVLPGHHGPRRELL